MSSNRIQIDGIWYVKEQPKYIIKDEDISESKVYHVENESYSLELDFLKINEEYSKKFIDLIITDKRVKGDWKKYTWDNSDFYDSLIERDSDSIEIAKEDICESGIEFVIAFITKLKEMKVL